MLLNKSAILPDSSSVPFKRPVKVYIDQLNNGHLQQVEVELAKFVFKRIDRLNEKLFFDMQPGQQSDSVLFTPNDPQTGDPLLGYNSDGKPKSATLVLVKLLQSQEDVYEARLQFKQDGYNISKRILFGVNDFLNDSLFLKGYTHLLDKVGTTKTKGNDLTNQFAQEASQVLKSIDVENECIIAFIQEKIEVKV